MMVCTRMTVIRQRREFLQSREKETRRIKFYIQADMYKESIEREENTRRYTMSLFCIMIEISTFFYIDILLVDNLCVDIFFKSIFVLVDIFLSTFRHLTEKRKSNKG